MGNDMCIHVPVVTTRWKVIVGLVARWKTWSNLFVQSLILGSRVGAILLPILQHFLFFSFVVIFSPMYGYTYSVNELNKVSSFITNSSLFVLFLSALNSKFLHIILALLYLFHSSCFCAQVLLVWVSLFEKTLAIPNPEDDCRSNSLD